MSNVFFKTVQVEIESYGFTVADKDFTRPWGGFLVINEDEAQAFANKFLTALTWKPCALRENSVQRF